MIASWILGCGEAPPPTPAFEPSPVAEEVPWLLDGTEPEPVDLAGVLDAANDAIARVAVLDPDPVLDAYRDLAAGADPGCPAIYADDLVEYWLDSCVSRSGTTFDGFGIDDQVVVDDGGDGYALSATGGTGRIEDGEGTWLAFDGLAQRIDDAADGITVSSLVLSGSFATNHPAADGTWVGEGVRPNVTITRYEALGTPVAFAIVGALDDLPGDHPAVAFGDTAMIDPAIGVDGCALEPSGVVSVRLLSGAWVDLVFDPELGDDGAVVVEDPASCDGCGTAWYRAEALGEACLDFGPWLR